jgi:hypothetical protein
MAKSVKVPQEATRAQLLGLKKPKMAEAAPETLLRPYPKEVSNKQDPGYGPQRQPFLTRNKTKLTTGGLTALAGLGLLKAKNAADSNKAFREAGQDEELHRRQTVLADMAGLVRSQSLEASIQANLAEVQRQSPFLYNQVAAGRVLPQGAVVLGGRTRQDLLQELGRSMSEGQFSQ